MPEPDAGTRDPPSTAAPAAAPVQVNHAAIARARRLAAPLDERCQPGAVGPAAHELAHARVCPVAAVVERVRCDVQVAAEDNRSAGVQGDSHAVVQDLHGYDKAEIAVHRP